MLLEHVHRVERHVHWYHVRGLGTEMRGLEEPQQRPDLAHNHGVGDVTVRELVDPLGRHQTQLGGKVRAVHAKRVGGQDRHHVATGNHGHGHRIPRKRALLREQVAVEELQGGKEGEEIP